jgi:dTDP-4-amino-4,6-dideoxygalactose transaminase
MIPFVDIQRFHAPIRAALHAAALRVIDGGKYIGGEEVKRFEQEMAAGLGVPEVCGVACATSGLFAILKGLGIGPGDEVITSVHTAIATAEAISLTGAQVVFCDLQPGYFFLDAREVEQRITARTRAIIPVHLYGQPADLDSLRHLAQRHGLFLVEDCAQSQGARYRNQAVGTIGDASVFSFFPSKNLGGFGDGGAVVARNPQSMKRIRMLSNHGRDTKYDHEFEGVNSRLDALQAALLRVCLPQLDEWNAQRRQVARWYDTELAGLASVQTPRVWPETEPVYHVYVILAQRRDELQAFLKQRQIETGIHYPLSLNLQPAYARLKQPAGSFPRAEAACQQVLSLPMHPAISQAEVGQVCVAIRAFYSDHPCPESIRP